MAPCYSYVRKERKKVILGSISPTFYELLFRMKVFHEAFLTLHFRFVLFLAQEYLRKCAHKMLVKLTNEIEITDFCWQDPDVVLVEEEQIL
jgi:hypothetical protein